MATWSIEDKKKLLLAVQKHGINNIETIQELLPHKTVTEIRCVFEKYTTAAIAKWNRYDKERDEDSAINQWIKVLKKTKRENGIIDIVPRVLKYIALFENRPFDKDVNIRDCYLTLAEISKGKAAKSLDPNTAHFFYENLSKLARYLSKTNFEKEKAFLGEIKNIEQLVKPQTTVKTYNRHNRKANAILNPLSIPEDLLRKNATTAREQD